MKVVKALGTEDSAGVGGGVGLVLVVAIVRLRRRQWGGEAKTRPEAISKLRR